MISAEGQILLIDDDPGIRSTLSDILEDQGYKVQGFGRGREALDFLKKNSSDVVFVDLKLPDIDGMELLEQIKLINPESAVIMITGHASMATAVEALNEGAYAYVVKPFDLDELKTIVNKAIKGIRLSLENKELIDQLQGTNRELERYKKSLEDAVREAERMTQQAAEATKAKGSFLANMSHEIRTPMNAIIGFSDMLSEEQLTKAQTDYVNLIRESGNHLLSIINDILDFSKIEAGKLDIEVIDCSLAQLLNSIKSLMKPKAEEKGLEFELFEFSKLPSQIRTDPDRVRQCLINLTNNAIKFTAEGHVHINVSLEDKDNQPYIRFDIEDTGIGIPSKVQQEIFESFTQADGTTSRKYGGTGLGLAITRQLAELLGGELALTSEEGKGSVFSLIIPAGLDVTNQPFLKWDDITGHIDIPKEETNELRFSGDILVVEDVKTNQMLIELLLKRMGLEITIVKEGREAIQKASSRKYDLIFMDMHMSNMNGYDATKILREEGIRTPIVALTASAMRGDDKKCIDAGCDDYLSKPIERAKLIKIISKYLSPQSKVLTREVGSFEPETNELSKAGTCQSTQAVQQADRSNTENDNGPIDWKHVIDRGIDEALMKEIMPICINDNKEYLEMLASAVKASDFKNVELYAHAVKGSALNMGAIKLSQAASCLEYMASEDLKEAESLLQSIAMEFNRLKTFVSKPDWIETAKEQAANKVEMKHGSFVRT